MEGSVINSSQNSKKDEFRLSQPGSFDISNRYESLSKFGDPLERIAAVVDFEVFRDELESEFCFSSDRSKGGCPLTIVC